MSAASNRQVRSLVAEGTGRSGLWDWGVPSPVLGEPVQASGGVRSIGRSGGLARPEMVEGSDRGGVKRREHHIKCWIVDHLPDLWLFCVVTPLVLGLLVHAWIT
jgi:hypothetical protein